MAEQLGMARELVDLTLQEARAAIGGLRPPVLDDLGLAGGLASLARSIPPDRRPGRSHRNAAAGPHRNRAVPHRAGVSAERRQARGRLDGAADVRGRRRTDDTARLEIVDDGVGFDTFEHPLGSDEMGGYGLLSMAERAEIVGGRLNIRSRPGAGTAVTATIPLPNVRRETPSRIGGLEVASRVRALEVSAMRRSVSSPARAIRRRRHRCRRRHPC